MRKALAQFLLCALGMTSTIRFVPSSLRFASLLLVGGALACAKAQAVEKPPAAERVAVTTVSVREASVPATLTVTGSLLGNRESEVAADGAGRVLEASIERGQVVAPGAMLARLDARNAALGRRAATAEVQAASAQADNAQLECRRTEALFASGAVSRAELERTRAACVAAKSAADAASARAGLADKSVGDSVVRSPFAGVVVERAVDVGEYVTPGRRVATIVQIDPLRLELAIPESLAAHVASGKQVEFQVRAFEGETFRGAVRYVGPALRRASHDLVVEAMVDNRDQRLRPGMFAEAEITVGEQKLPVAPKSALIGTGPSAHLFVVEGGVAQERVVLSGRERGGSVAILDGVRPGELLVMNPGPTLRDGVAVR